ncbi:hypothetical protein BDN72DRAFT_844664 [Pluteus cervinus]|uniref:Uncharacterized protein n=1 Tax=Pluteus cervinus TaxID=181527 RepID=A0ACD3AKD6_9AGAR|nr:hypothetical protein BDN72DRAFT_844664 [Pluteus cervinus]
MEFLQPVRFSMTALGMWNDCNTPPPAPDFDSPLFQKVTHLDLTDNWEFWKHWTKFDSLPNLTHLELRLGSENDFKKVRQPLRAILSSCKKLEVLVILVNYQPGCILGLTAIGDPRCVVLRQASLTENWEAHARGKTDRWVKAESVVRAQRRAIAVHSKPSSSKSLS